MRKKAILTITLGIAAFTAALADRIPENKAVAIAHDFVNRSIKSKAMRNIRTDEKITVASKTDGHYVLNIGNGNGFVVVAGNDIAKNIILGYSDNGKFNSDSIPENMKWWLGEYDRQIAYMKNNSELFLHSTPTETKYTKAENQDEEQDNIFSYEEISPLLSSKWGQREPYNDQCPIKDNEKCPSGCVATALGQIMRYQKWPEHGFGSRNGLDFNNITFDWDNMLDMYEADSPQPTKDAVSTLMMALGKAMDMNYSPTGSGTNNDNALYAMKNYFGYSLVQQVGKQDLATASWDKYIYNELQHNRPVYYTGATVLREGHAFVCDGFRDGFFHINWGWNGMADGYFKTTAMDPPVQGIGGGSGGFNSNQAIFTNIFNPNDLSQKLLSSIHTESITSEKSNVTPEGELTLYGVFVTKTNESSYSFGAKVTSSDGKTTCIKEDRLRKGEQKADLAYSYTISLKDFPTEEGIYYITPIVYGEDSKCWYEMLSSSDFNNSTLTAYVNGSGITVYDNPQHELETSDFEVPEVMYTGETSTLKATIQCSSDELLAQKFYIGFMKEGDSAPLLYLQENTPSRIFKDIKTNIQFDITTPNKYGEYQVAIFDIELGKEKQLTEYKTTTITKRMINLSVTSQILMPGSNLTNVAPENVKINAKIKNSGTNFNDELRFIVSDLDTNEEVCTLTTSGSISNGSTKNVTFSGALTGTEANHMYYGKVYYKNEIGKWTPIPSKSNNANNIRFQTAGTSGISSSETQASSTADAMYSTGGIRLPSSIRESKSTRGGNGSIYIIRKNGKSIKIKN